MEKHTLQEEQLFDVDDDEDDVEEENQNWDDWNDDEEEDGGGGDEEKLLCLFCESLYGSADGVFEHCGVDHQFDFQRVRDELGLDFYGSFKLLNFIRVQVSLNKSRGLTCQSWQEVQSHLNEPLSFRDHKFPWDNDVYLIPHIQEDSLLYNFGEADEGGDECNGLVNKEELLGDLESFENIMIDSGERLDSDTVDSSSHMGTEMENGVGTSQCNSKDKKSNNDKLVVNKSYFGSYGSFGIHREMISDKVRTDAYRRAILNNPSLLKGAIVMDVGCGTGILSLFAAQAGASRVIAVEASDKMASVASQIVKDNGVLCSGVVEIVHGMVEDLTSPGGLQPHSVDVLLSEWMGYCLLYESMLSSVLIARDKWLKPGGAVLPDNATMFVAGFGQGGTSIPFWENVYGFNMSCVGRELVEDAAHVPIVDVVDAKDIVTNTSILQTFDLVTMKLEEVDFTSTVELEPKLDNHTECAVTWCYGIVLWFETSFTGKFCKEMPTLLSTSPFTPSTHWSQTLLTFKEPIAIASASRKSKFANETSESVGTDNCPAMKLNSRISISRGIKHRSIDISLEMTGVGVDGRKRSWSPQIFNLY